MNKRQRSTAAAAGILALVGASAFGYPQQGGDPGTAAPTIDKNPAPLGGPKVAPTNQKETLVERDFSGKVKRLEAAPAEAAVKLVELSEAERTGVDRVLAERAATLDKIVRDNLLLIVSVSQTLQAGDRAGIRDSMKVLTEKSEAMRKRGDLLRELRSVVAPEKHEQMQVLVREYWSAVIEEHRAAAKAVEAAGEMEGGEVAPERAIAEAMRGEYVAAVGREIRRSYDRVVTAAGKELDDLLKQLALSPGQEAEARRIIQDAYFKAETKPTQAEKTKAFIDVYKLLDADQRAKLMELVGQRQAKGVGPK